MARPSLFDTKKLQTAALKIKERGPEGVEAFLKEEPVFEKWIGNVVKHAMQKIFEGRHPQDPGEQETYEKTVRELQFACVKVLTVTRECYRDLSENLLTTQYNITQTPPKPKTRVEKAEPETADEEPEEDEEEEDQGGVKWQRGDDE